MVLTGRSLRSIDHSNTSDGFELIGEEGFVVCGEQFGFFMVA